MLVQINSETGELARVEFAPDAKETSIQDFVDGYDFAQRNILGEKKHEYVTWRYL